MERLAKKSRDELGRPNAAEFLDIWRKRFSTQLQKCNAKAIMRKISTLTNDIDCTVDCSTQFLSHSLSWLRVVCNVLFKVLHVCF